MNIFNYVFTRLRSTRYKDLPFVARDSGVPESTIKKIRSGEIKDPRVSTVQSLCDYFDSLEQKGPSIEG